MRWACPAESSEEDRAESRFGRWTIAFTLAVSLACGWWITDRHGRIADEEIREGLLAQARAVAGTVNPDDVKALLFRGDDVNKPQFQQLRNQMTAYAKTLGHPSIYRDRKSVV